MTVATRIYELRCKYGCVRHSRYPTLGDEHDALLDSISQDPITHWLVQSQGGRWRTSQFVIQSEAMRVHLRALFDDYPDYDPALAEWTFSPPYSQLIHRWDRLQQLAAMPTHDPKAKQAVDQLVEFLTPLLAGSVDALASVRETGMIVYNNLWQIFPPGILALATLHGAEILCRVRSWNARYGSATVEYVDWNGQQFGLAQTDIQIDSFEAQKYVDSLMIYPLSFHKDPEEVKERLLERGRWFEAMRGYHFMSYEGTHLVFQDANENEKGRRGKDDDEPYLVERRVSGRIVLDAFAYFHSKSRNLPLLGSLTGERRTYGDGIVPSDSGEAEGYSSGGEEMGHPQRQGTRIPYHGHSTYRPRHGHVNHYARNEYDQPRPDQAVYGSPRAHRHQQQSPEREHEHVPRKRPERLTRDDNVGSLLERSELEQSLTDDQCLITSPWMRGMDLKTKNWGYFSLDSVKPIVWNDDAFDNLILHGNEKQLAWRFIENKALADESFDDFIADKGRGIIILMFGPPGVGKTFTAEAVAERARLPLYSVSAATLGASPKKVEENLGYALNLCKLWNAMLLLDEADVFINSRTDSDLIRNELVAVFLTKLEYYQGICFMTTNRTASIDPAMQSRVDLFLRYKDLTLDTRRRVWVNFINKTGKERFDLSGSEIDTMSGFKLNGREIKNLIKTANLLSLKEQKRIDMETLSMLAANRIEALEALGLAF